MKKHDRGLEWTANYCKVMCKICLAIWYLIVFGSAISVCVRGYTPFVGFMFVAGTVGLLLLYGGHNYILNEIRKDSQY